MLGTALLLASVTVGAWAACQYEIQNFKLDTCDGKPVKEWTLKDVGAVFTDECNVRITGCFKINEPLNNIEVDYTAMKNGLAVTRGSEKVCGIKLFDTTFSCPMAKNTNVCSTKSWVKELPKGMLNMAKGKITGEAKVKSSVGVKCYKVSADIKKK